LAWSHTCDWNFLAFLTGGSFWLVWQVVNREHMARLLQDADLQLASAGANIRAPPFTKVRQSNPISLAQMPSSCVM
jgi:hypothetical protein